MMRLCSIYILPKGIVAIHATNTEAVFEIGGLEVTNFPPVLRLYPGPPAINGRGESVPQI
jgi:hypothetical protein